MNPRARPLRAGMHSAVALLACLAGILAVPAASTAAAPDEFVYRTRPGDTLIGISARLLKQPSRWPAVQSLNAIRDPRRMPRDTPLRIPRDWLRTTPEAATAVSVAGRATLDGRPLVPGERAPAGATVETAADGAVTLELADGSTVTLQKSGTLELERLDRVADLPVRDVQLHLRRGRIDTRAKPQADGSRFRIRTAVAVSAVRGTEFRTAVLPATGGGGSVADRDAAATPGTAPGSPDAAAAATTETLEGGVALTSPDTPAAAPRGAAASRAAVAPATAGEVVVAGGFGTRVDEGAPPRAPRALLPAPDLAGLPATNERAALEVAFPAVNGAVRYRVQLATDAEFRGIVGDLETVAARASFATLPDGEYWLRARAIDELAIEGVDAVHRVTQRRRSAPPPPALAIVARTGTLARLEWSVPHATAFDVQVARDPAFSRIVAEQRVATGEFDWRAPSSGRYYVRARNVDANGAAGEFGSAVVVDSPWPWWAKVLLPLLFVGAAL